MTDQKCAWFTEYISKSIKSKLADDLTSCNYYSCLNDGSLDSGATDQEVVFVLLLKESTPTLKYSIIESVKIVDAPGIAKSIEDVFEKIANKSFTYKLVGIGVDWASVNLGKHSRVGKLIQEKVTWLQVIHCFNHWVELVLKDTFKTTAFEDIDTTLCKLCYLYQKSAKSLCELRILSEAYDKTIPKLMKASETRNIHHN